MFRPIRKKKNDIGAEAAEQLLLHCRRGVLAMYGMEGYVGAVRLQKKNIWCRVLYMTLGATVLELICGLLLRYGLGMKAWSYENSFMNYKGIICLGFSLAWGVAAFGFCKLYPYISKFLNRLKAKG